MVGGLNWCSHNKVNRHVSNQGLMDAQLDIFIEVWSVYVYICLLYIQYIVIDISIHINQLCITQMPKNRNKQRSSCMEQPQLLVSVGSALCQSFIHLGIKLGICVQNGLLWQGKDQKGFGGGNHSGQTVTEELQLKEQKGPMFIFGCRIGKVSSRS